nr:MAG TPA: GcrA cell cycle regulator [Caudoviricetes sp.]
MYTNEQKQTIIQYYQEGKSINWIANTLNTRWESVKNLLVRENLYQQVKRNGKGVIQPEIIRFN